MDKNSRRINRDDHNPQEDLVDAGFKRLDPHLVERLPPRIRWGVLYQKRSMRARLAYAEKLAATMNQAAAKIQEERNTLGKLLVLKEKQLIKMSEAVQANNAMLQQEVTRMNENRQILNAELARLNKQVKKQAQQIKDLEEE